MVESIESLKVQAAVGPMWTREEEHLYARRMIETLQARPFHSRCRAQHHLPSGHPPQMRRQDCRFRLQASTSEPNATFGHPVGRLEKLAGRPLVA